MRAEVERVARALAARGGAAGQDLVARARDAGFLESEVPLAALAWSIRALAREEGSLALGVACAAIAARALGDPSIAVAPYGSAGPIAVSSGSSVLAIAGSADRSAAAGEIAGPIADLGTARWLACRSGARLGPALPTLGFRELSHHRVEEAHWSPVEPPERGLPEILFSSLCLGLAESACSDAKEYSGQRWQGGREIRRWSAVERMLGEMESRVSYVGLALESPFVADQAPALLLRAQASARDVTDLGLQILGGAGYTADHRMERLYRDARQAMGLLGPWAERRAQLGGAPIA